MKMVNTYEAKTHLSALIKDAEAGEEIIIAKAGKPIARLVAYSQQHKPREPGMLKGRIHIRPDFDAPLPPDVASAFAEPTE